MDFQIGFDEAAIKPTIKEEGEEERKARVKRRLLECPVPQNHGLLYMSENMPASDWFIDPVS